jgi:uncharacterized RDD family membrane protein YckC
VSTQTQQARPLDVQVIGRRISAVVIDYFILGIALGMLFWVFSLIFPNLPVVTAQQGTPPVELGRSLLDAALFGLALQWLLRPVYFIGLEGYGGQTIGKGILGIKVVSESTGQGGGFRTATKRNLPRVVLSVLFIPVYVLVHIIGPSGLPEGLDSAARLTSIVWADISIVDYLRDVADDIWSLVLVATGIVGLLTMSFSGKTQRLGDMVAHTLVVGK